MMDSNKLMEPDETASDLVDAISKLHPHQQEALDWLSKFEGSPHEMEIEFRGHPDQMPPIRVHDSVHQPMIVEPAWTYEDSYTRGVDRLTRDRMDRIIAIDHKLHDRHGLPRVVVSTDETGLPEVVIASDHPSARDLARKLRISRAVRVLDTMDPIFGSDFLNMHRTIHDMNAPFPRVKAKEPPKQTDADRLALARAVSKRLTKAAKLKRSMK
jgi:hypothetical protein